jgi:hypothetical protein
LPPITSQITIEGNGATIARQGDAPDFGLMAVRGSEFLGVGVPPGPRGDLTLQNVTLSGGSSFGGLLNRGTASIKNSIISGNSGGGVSTNNGILTIKNSTISGNTTPGGGGGVNNYIGGVAITNSTISDNTANSSGGGVANYHGNVAITNSTISDNTANSSGGGVYNAWGYNGYYGGGGSVTITNSTISGNRANRGGGIFNTQSAALTLNNSLIFGNQAPVAPEIENRGIVTATNFNLFGALNHAGDSGFVPGPTDIVLEPNVSVAQILGPLKNNGGPTQTHALVAGSPAIDAGNPNGCQDNSGALLQTDQRGFPRNVDGNSDGTARCDIGAVEFNNRDFPFTLVAAVLPSSRSVQVGNVATAFATIINTDSNPATGCAISPITNIPATFTFQTTNPATNQVTGSPNTPVDMPAGAAQSFVFALTPTAPMAPTDVQLSFDCDNTDPALVIPGLNTLLFSASSTPTPDLMALAATLSGDGIVNIPGPNGTGVFALATVNMGAGDTITVLADTGGAILPVNIFICQTDPQSGACLSPPADSVTTMILSNETPTFGVFVVAAGDVAFVPETNRIFVRFTDSSGVTRGLTSVAVRTQ